MTFLPRPAAPTAKAHRVQVEDRCSPKTASSKPGNRGYHIGGFGVLTTIKTVALYVADQQRSVDFYVDKLGFEKVTDPDGHQFVVSATAEETA